MSRDRRGTGKHEFAISLAVSTCIIAISYDNVSLYTYTRGRMECMKLLSMLVKNNTIQFYTLLCFQNRQDQYKNWN